MMFDKKSFDLRKWSLTDERGQTTTITISNVKEDIHVAEETFKIDYAANREYNTPTKSR
ncbi:outer membrane lipoprotein carrier protein LolA [Mesorhizobium loti]|uniref:Outer membrane lipoprotein carrier protein LolA n=1 Tax=Rhizobium loti TaxID=381 RepID=A0A8E2W614_RHILI|nr:outer membrane lipoprotein carrier protein LolA [Mesorhizobium loti]